MLKSRVSPDFFGSVDLEVTINGIDWHKFPGGFYHYKQPTVNDIFPNRGPATGSGIINFYGKDFRDDFPLAKVACKFGNSIGKAEVVNEGQIRCIVENMELTTGNQSLAGSVALNNYSWTKRKASY